MGAVRIRTSARLKLPGHNYQHLNQNELCGKGNSGNQSQLSDPRFSMQDRHPEARVLGVICSIRSPLARLTNDACSTRCPFQ